MRTWRQRWLRLWRWLGRPNGFLLFLTLLPMLPSLGLIALSCFGNTLVTPFGLGAWLYPQIFLGVGQFPTEYWDLVRPGEPIDHVFDEISVWIFAIESGSTVHAIGPRGILISSWADWEFESVRVIPHSVHVLLATTIAVTLAIAFKPVALCFARRRLVQHRRRHHCRGCGYYLHPGAVTKRCPECGRWSHLLR